MRYSARNTKLCTLSQLRPSLVRTPTHEGFAVRLDRIVGEVPAGDHLCPVGRGVSDLFADVDGGLGDGLRGGSARHVGRYSAMLLEGIRAPENGRAERVDGCGR